MQTDKTVYKKMLIYLITFTPMFRLRSFAKPRAFYDADGGQGGGGQVTDPATDPNTNPQNPNPADPQDPSKNPPAKDPAAETRYQTQRFRERAEKAERELETFRNKERSNKPHFDPDDDPDGSKERNWEIESKASQLLDKRLKELGVEDTLTKIQYEKEEQQFFEVVQNEAQKFKDLGIEAPSKEALKQVLTTIDEK
jgi:hypothetical protein